MNQVDENRQAIDEYFGSELYRFRSDGVLVSTGQASIDAAHQSHLEKMLMGDRDLLPLASFAFGMIGISFLLVVTATVMPFALEAFDNWLSQGTFVETMLILQLFVCPPLICFSMVTVTPMFWYGSVTLRFLTAAIAVLPGCVGFYLALSYIEGIPNNDFWFGFVAVMFADFLAAGSVALTIQMWTPWTLSHEREVDSPLPSLGTRSLMELTLVAAVGCAIVFAFDYSDVLEGILFFAGVGFCSSAAIIGVHVAFLRRSAHSPWAITAALLFTYLTTFLFCAVVAAGGFGYEAIFHNMLILSGVSLFGMVIVGLSFGVNLWWLHLCGWHCVKRVRSGE